MMSKKSKKAKQARRAQQAGQIKQLPQTVSKSTQIYEWLLQLIREQIRVGDFAGVISSCEPLLNTLPRHSEMRMEMLQMLGLAHGMLKHYQESYDIFGEAISIDPTIAELWYNRGLACSFMSRVAEAVRCFERAVELSKNDTSTMAHKIAVQLKKSRQELQEAMQSYEEGITLEQYVEREERFTQALNLMKQEKWSEAELLYRQLTGTKSRIPSYWGNLGICLIMQFRYDEAEVAFKQALAIDPDYPVARDNLQLLPQIRHSKQLPGLKLINPNREEDTQQSLALYEKNEEGKVTSSTVIEKFGHAMTNSGKQLGTRPPRYDFFLNIYKDTRFTTCPRCSTKTRTRKFSLAINVNPNYTALLEKMCRFCYVCNLLIIHQDQLEEQLATQFTMINPDVIGNDYQVLGTLDKAEWDQGKHEPLSFEQVREYLHDFKEVITFKPVLTEM